MVPDFVKNVIDAFSKIKEEIDEKRGELDFRHSLANYLLKNVLEWGRKKGEGHYEIREREDIRLFDDHNRCVAIIETKNPKIARLMDAHRSEMKEHLDDYKGIAQYGALTNGHELKLFEYTGEGELNELASIDIDAFVEKGAEALSKTERQNVHLLRRLRKDRFVEVSPEYFRKTAQTIKIEEPKNFDLFIEYLRGSLDELTRIIYERFFKFYWEAGPNHYGGKFLREEAFRRWKGASAGKEEELREKFCRETAYVVLNRILFTRILEDKEMVKRMISGEGIADLLKWGESAYEMAIKQAYKNVEKFYEHFYEFGIFDWWRLSEDKLGMLTEDEKRIQKEIEDEFNTIVVRDILKRLNQFDFRKVSRDILGDVYQEYLPPAERKRLGEFYTTVEVVRYILDAVGYTSENRIEDKLLLDPACGSGTFLVEAAKGLAKRYEEKLKYPLQPDNAKIIIEGIVNNIHGLDINPFACHIAEMNMLFNIIDYLHAVHGKYKDYRLPRFNICCTDSLTPLKMEATPITEYITNGRIRSHLEETRRAKQVKKKEFDFVVGNPPYVRKESIPRKYKERVLKKSFLKIYHGDNDLYVYFIGNGIRWLRDKGNLGFIVSRKFTKTRYGTGIRNFILNKCCIEEYIDFADTAVFRDVTNYPCIIILKREIDESKLKSYPIKTVVIKKEMAGDRELLNHIEGNIAEKHFSDAYVQIFETNSQSLSHTEWKMIPAETAEVFAKVKKGANYLLGDICDLYYGIKTGNNEVFITNEEYVQKLKLERDILKPVLEGKDVRRYKILKKRKFLIFPYTKKAQKYERVKIEDYPSIENFFMKFKERLANRYDIKKTKRQWYELRPCHYYHIFESPKIITPKMAEINSFAYDEGIYFCLDSCFEMVFKNEYQENSLKYLVGLLNSKLLEFYFKQIGTFVRGRWYIYHIQYLKQLPIKLPHTSKEKRTASSIIEKVDRILHLNKQLEELGEKIERFPESYFGGEKLVNAAEECKLSKDKYDTKSLALKPVKKAGEELYKLALTKDDFILFSSRAVAECSLEQLKRKKKVRIEEIHGLKVPLKKDASRIMGDFSSDKKRVDEIRKDVEKLELEIDELVYELYGLDDENREVIKEFLKF